MVNKMSGYINPVHRGIRGKGSMGWGRGRAIAGLPTGSAHRGKGTVGEG